MIIKIKKRDGRTVTFNIEKIAGAIYKAAQSVGKDNYEEVDPRHCRCHDVSACLVVHFFDVLHDRI